MLNIKDVVDLAKAGYTPKDVKELIELSKTSESSQSETQPAQAAEPIISQSTPAETEPDNVSSAAPKESEPTATEPDYKALYEAEKAKVNDLQIKNTQADVSAPQTSEKDLIDLVRSFC